MIVVIHAVRVKILQVIYLRLFLTDLRLCIHVLVISPLSTLCLRSPKHKPWSLNLPRLHLCFGSFGRANILRKQHWLIEYILIAFGFTEYYDRLRLTLSFWSHKLCGLNTLLSGGCYNRFSVVMETPGRKSLQRLHLGVGLDEWGRRWCWLVTWLTYTIVAHRIDLLIN